MTRKFPAISVKSALLLVAVGAAGMAHAQQAHESRLVYTPGWTARHHLQILTDTYQVPLLVSQWPQPSAAILRILSAQTTATRNLTPVAAAQFETSRTFVIDDIHRQLKAQGVAHVRTRSENLVGFDDNYTPGSSVRVLSSALRPSSQDPDPAVEGRIGWRLEEQPASIGSPAFFEQLPRRHVNLEGSSAVLAWGQWNLQAFSHRFWWGPAWQSSLINGNNAPAWTGLGIQRSTTQAPTNPLLSWTGPWMLDFFVAQARDPRVVSEQAQGYLFSGTRLTLKPRSWMEIGLSRGIQFGGAGRPSGAKDFGKALLGQQTNKEITDGFEDSSGQLAGYDLRLTCPPGWANSLGGQCAVYTQWIGEDSAGKALPLPYKFMSLWGMEHGLQGGRHRLFAEYANTNTGSLPWENSTPSAGYQNGVYRQGYTQQTRWAGSAQGGGSEMVTVGWLDVSRQQRLRLFAGKIGTSLGSYNPSAPDVPRGSAWGLAWDKTWLVHGMDLKPEIAYVSLKEGQASGTHKPRSLRLGLAVQWPSATQ